MLSIYGKYKFIEDGNVSCFAKLGYTFPELDFDNDYDYNIDVSGGLMYGIELLFDNISLSYTISKGELEFPNYYYYYDDDSNITLNRISISYSF